MSEKMKTRPMTTPLKGDLDVDITPVYSDNESLFDPDETCAPSRPVDPLGSLEILTTKVPTMRKRDILSSLQELRDQIVAQNQLERGYHADVENNLRREIKEEKSTTNWVSIRARNKRKRTEKEQESMTAKKARTKDQARRDRQERREAGEVVVSPPPSPRMGRPPRQKTLEGPFDKAKRSTEVDMLQKGMFGMTVYKTGGGYKVSAPGALKGRRARTRHGIRTKQAVVFGMGGHHVVLTPDATPGRRVTRSATRSQIPGGEGEGGDDSDEEKPPTPTPAFRVAIDRAAMRQNSENTPPEAYMVPRGQQE